MKRRSFLKGLAIAPAAAPAVAHEALRAEIPSGVGYGLDTVSGGIGIPVDTHEKDWLKKDLSNLLGMSRKAMEMERLQARPMSLDPNTAALRSVSQVNKIRISRDQQYWRQRQQRKSFLEARISGWFD